MNKVRFLPGEQTGGDGGSGLSASRCATAAAQSVEIE